MSALGVVSTIKHPELTSVLSDAIIQFELEYDRYLNQIEQINQNRTPSRRIKPIGRKSCIAPELLQSLVEMESFDDCDDVVSVTETHVIAWMNSRRYCEEDDLAGRVEDALAEVEFKPSRFDPVGASIMFFSDVRTELRKHGAENAINQASKALFNRLIPKLQPAVVRETIKKEQPYWLDDKRYDLKYFQAKVAEISRESAKYTGNRRHLEVEENRGGGSKRKRHAKGKYNAKRLHTDEISPRSRGDNERAKAKPSPTHGAKGARNTQEWTTPCLNPKCGKIHPLKDCEDTSDAQKDELFKMHRAGKKKMSALRSIRPTDGRWKVIVEDVLDAIALGDIGADVSAVSRRVIEELTETANFVSTTKLPTPVSLDVAVKMPNDVEITATSKARLSIKLILPCGPLRLRRVEFLIVDNDMDEILLGRPLLRSLGFDLDAHLSQVREQYDNVDVSTMTLKAHPDEGLSLKRFATYTGLRYDSVDDDPIPLPETAGAGIGVDAEAEIDSAIRNMLQDAQSNGMSEQGLAEVTSLLHEFKDVFRIKLGPDPPAKVAPLEIQLKPGHRPVRATQRRYAPPQRAFISSTIRRLEEVGAVVHNPKSRWASPALAVAKPGPEKFRFTVDLRAPNAATIPKASAMPNLEALFQTTQGSKFFANIDLCHAYWQIPLHPASQECMSIQTPLGVYTPCRVLQGGTDAGNHFQACTAQIFQELADCLLQWLDDFLIHATTEAELLQHLHKFLSLCREFGLKVHATKSHIFMTEVHFCGRVIDGDGIRFDPRRLDTLLNMRRPERGNELQQFLCAANWMRTSIPAFSKVTAPLHQLMESCYAKCNKRTKRAVRAIQLAGLWGADHDSAFQQIKEQLAQSLKLAYPRDGCEPCLFSDASETHWSSVLTQVPKRQMDLAIEQQDHDPLSFLSGSFTGASENWSIVEKEAFAIVESMTRLEYLIAVKEVSLFTDHANLIYIFDPVGQNPGIARHTANKLLRWALKLSGHRYVIEHLSGERNVWADILTRWAVTPNTAAKRLRIASLLVAPISPSLSKTFDSPSRAELISCQAGAQEFPPVRFKNVEGLFQDKDKIVWIPDKNNELMKLRILIASHTGVGGHRGIGPSFDAVRTHFHWIGMKGDVTAFCKSCLHCLCTSTGATVPRPLGHAMHAERPNEILHFDFCYIGKSDGGNVYGLILKDDFSSHVWLFPCVAADAEATADALMEWFSSFGTVAQWVSDRGSHFKNMLVRELKSRLHSAHHFTLAYCPWTNGSVEVVCRELIRAMRALMSEYQLPFRRWPTVLPVVQSILNNTPLARLNGVCPLTAFTQLPSDSPLTAIKKEVNGEVTTVSIDEARAAQAMRVEELEKALEGFHRAIFEKANAVRQRRVEKHIARTHVRPCNFDVGDFVLCGRLQKNSGPKLALKSYGPKRVVRVLSEFLFEVQDLRSGEKAVIHGSRLKFFRNKDFEITLECTNQLAYQEGELCLIDSLLDLREKDGKVHLLVKWSGFEDEEPAWEDIVTIRENVPAMAQDFLDRMRESGNRRQRAIARSID